MEQIVKAMEKVMRQLEALNEEFSNEESHLRETSIVDAVRNFQKIRRSGGQLHEENA